MSHLKNIILVVDDAMDMRIYLKTLLRSDSMPVEAVRNGTEGLARVKEGGVSLVVLDIMMPGEGGIIMYRELKGDAELAKIPVIIHSAIPERMFAHYLRMEVGCGRVMEPPAAYFEKPAEPGLLKETVTLVTSIVVSASRGYDRGEEPMGGV